MTAPHTVLLDGLWGWKGRIDSVAAHLTHRGLPTTVYRYPHSGCHDIRDLGHGLSEFIRQQGWPSVNLIGFSMGGLVCRAAVLADPTLPVRRAAFVNTPHGGTWVAWLLPLRGIRQMRPKSDFLRELDAQPWSIRSLAIWCPGDLMVVPGCSAKWPCASQTLVCTVPMHIWPLLSRTLQTRVAQFLQAV